MEVQENVSLPIPHISVLQFQNMNCSSKGFAITPASRFLYELLSTGISSWDLHYTTIFYTFLLGYCLASWQHEEPVSGPPPSLPQPAGRYTRLLMLIELQQAASCCPRCLHRVAFPSPTTPPPFHLFRLNYYRRKRKSSCEL